MAQNSFEKAMPRLFAHEGGYADHPSDPGGATKYGITHQTLSDWRGRPVTKTDVRRLTQAEAAEIYKARYWDALCCDDLPAGADYCVFDAGVNSGPGRATRWLQAALRVDQDGIVGPRTLAAAQSADPRRLIDDICDVRLAFLRGLSTWAVFGRGWERRVADVRETARAMARAGVGDHVPDAEENPAAPSTGTPPSPPSTGFWAAVAALLRALLVGENRQ
jgi:lysozyme family protein